MDSENKNQEPFKDPMVEAFGEMLKGMSKSHPVFEVTEAINKLKKLDSIQTATKSHNECELVADFIESASAGNFAVQCRMWGYVANISRAFEKAINDNTLLPSKEFREVLAAHVAVMLGDKGRKLLLDFADDDEYQDKLQSMADNYAPRTDDEMSELEAEKNKIEKYLESQGEQE